MVARAKSRIEASKLYMPMATPPAGGGADEDGLGPAGHEPRDAGPHDRLAEDDAAQDVADGAVRRPPHLLQPELGHPVLVRRDRGALDAHAVALDGVGRVHRDLVIGGVPLLDREVVVLQVDIQVGQDQLVLDELPDNPRHLVAVEFDDGIGHLDLGHAAAFLPPACHGAFAMADNSGWSRPLSFINSVFWSAVPWSGSGGQVRAGKTSPATSRPTPSTANAATSRIRRREPSMPAR